MKKIKYYYLVLNISQGQYFELREPQVVPFVLATVSETVAETFILILNHG